MRGITRETTNLILPVGPVRVLVADNFLAWRNAVRELLAVHPQLELIAEVGNGSDAAREAGEHQPDLVLLDVMLPKPNGIETARKIRQAVPNAKIILLTAESDDEIVLMGLASGANGYVLKTDAARELWLAIEMVLDGKQFLSSGVMRRKRSEIVPICAHQLAFPNYQFRSSDRSALMHIEAVPHSISLPTTPSSCTCGMLRYQF